MKRTSLLIALSLILFTLPVTGQANLVSTNSGTIAATSLDKDKPIAPLDNSRSNRCSEKSVKGSYGIAFSGVINGVGPVATLGVITLDSKGGFSINDTASFNGFTVDRVGDGNYTINADCTGNATVTYSVGQPGRQAAFNLVVLEGGREILLISTSSGAIVSGKASLLSSK